MNSTVFLRLLWCVVLYCDKSIYIASHYASQPLCQPYRQTATNCALLACFQRLSLSSCWFGNGGCGRIGVKSVCSVSFGVICCCGCCLIIFVFGTAIVRVTVLVSGFTIFLASATTLLLVLNINSSASHFVSSSTFSICHELHLSFVVCLAVLSCSYSYLATSRVYRVHFFT